MPPPPLVVDRDRDQLKMLVLMHYVYGAVGVLLPGFLYTHYVSMQSMLGNQELFPAGAASAPAEVGQVFGVLRIIYWVVGSLAFADGLLCLGSGYALSRTRGRVFSQVVAVLTCLNFPIGTALGVFALIVLARDSVRVRYEYGHLTPAPQPAP